MNRLSLTVSEARKMVRAMRSEGVEPPRVGWCVKWRGGTVCRHPKYSYSPEGAKDSGLQTINVSWSTTENEET